MLHVPIRTLEDSARYQFERWSYPAMLFLSASLLFVLQPMVAKRLLPVFGGTPAVWTVCMLFFQTMLLFGYAYAWGLSRLKGTISWRAIHLLVCLASLYFLPLQLTPVVTKLDPVYQILQTLVLQLGLPVLVISSSAPLLQYAFSQTDSKKSRDPYFLYVASNVGSLLALVSYPCIIERVVGVGEQFHLWGLVYAFYIIFISVLLLRARLHPVAIRQQLLSGWKNIVSWLGLSFIPCSLMLGVTLHISTDIASTPLFWVIPLALYLLSFIITFAEKPWIKPIWLIRLMPIAVLSLLLSFFFGAAPIPSGIAISMNLVVFFMVALLCHARLVASRPPAPQLTFFYLCMAFGGVLAGVFNSIIAPLIFPQAYEFPLVMLLAVVCLLPFKRWIVTFSVGGILGVFLLTQHGEWMQAFHMADTIAQQRNFYGIKRVFAQNQAHYFMSQSTLHGFQLQTRPENTNGAIAYYGPISPVIDRIQKQWQIQPIIATRNLL